MAFFKWRNTPDLETRHVSHLDMVNAAILEQGRAGTDNLAAVFRSVSMLSDMVSSLPIFAVDPVSGLRLDETPAILRTPDPSKTRHDFMNEVMSSLLYRGNCYLFVPAVDRSGNAIAFMVIPPDEVTVTETANRQGVIYEWVDRDITLVPDRNLIHIRLSGRPRSIVGMGPIEAARVGLEGYQNLERYARDYFRDNANPNGVLSSPGTIDTKEADALKKQWNEAHRGKREIAVLGGGIEFTPLSFSPEDSQFLQTREFEVSDVARLFGIPAPLLGASSGDSLTYATTESVVRWLLVTTLNPTYLERIEQAMSRMLPRTQIANFDTRALLRADTQARFASHKLAIESGFMTPNEVRQLERLEPRVDGDGLVFVNRGNLAQGFGEPSESGNVDLEATSE